MIGNHLNTSKTWKDERFTTWENSMAGTQKTLGLLGMQHKYQGLLKGSLGGGNSNIFYVHPYLGKMNPF